MGVITCPTCRIPWENEGDSIPADCRCRTCVAARIWPGDPGTPPPAGVPPRDGPIKKLLYLVLFIGLCYLAAVAVIVIRRPDPPVRLWPPKIYCGKLTHECVALPD
jgi:hypothetical protein